jgi:translocation and assembly module TamB
VKRRWACPSQLRSQFQGEQMRVSGRVDAARIGSLDLGGEVGLRRIDQLLALDADPR